MKSRRCAKPTIEFGPTQGWVWGTPYFSSSPPQFGVLGFAASVYFLLVETVACRTHARPDLDITTLTFNGI